MLYRIICYQQNKFSCIRGYIIFGLLTALQTAVVNSFPGLVVFKTF